jgi:UDP-N-acetylmuramoyl-L-alanyl-D-glutamate--2,6-diaminopimelate ligase
MPPVSLPEICRLVGVEAQPGSVTGVTLDSHAVAPGDLYAALPGARTHGARFAADAVRAGAAAILTDPAGLELSGPWEVPTVVCPDPRAVLGAVSAMIYGHPARRLRTFAVTGTNGKTTVTYMLAAALAALSVPTGLIGTTGTWVGTRRLPTLRTTPEAPDVQAILATMVAAGMRAVAMEVSSHALVLGRVDGLQFDVSGFTNLSPDHLDFHADMEDYFSAKAGLFTAQRSRRAVLNVDDRWGRRLAETVTIPAVTYGFAEADWTADLIESDAAGSHFVAVHAGATVPVRVSAPGRFNVANALGALVMLAEAGFDVEDAAQAIAAFGGVPGRMEVVRAGPDPTSDVVVVVDYAHTPEAVRGALLTMRPLTQGRIWCVLGCGGDRDAIKRPAMGRIAAENADHVVVTDDNPRTEDPAAIRAAVLAGAHQAAAAGEVREIGERGEAIATVVAEAAPGDTVMILGKGHETGQEIAGTIHPFDDRVVAREALERRP